MSESSLVIGLAATFAGITMLLVVLALALPSPFLVVVALPFALVAALMWYHGTGRFEARVRRQARRSDRTRGRRSRRATDERARRVGPRGATAGNGKRGRGGGRTAQPPGDSGPTPTEAYRRLDLSPGAGEDAIRQAYREKVKVTHPDRGGDKEEFKRVTAAYERLTGD